MTIPYSLLFADAETLAVLEPPDDLGLCQAAPCDPAPGNLLRRGRYVGPQDNQPLYQQCGGGRRILRKRIGGN